MEALKVPKTQINSSWLFNYIPDNLISKIRGFFVYKYRSIRQPLPNNHFPIYKLATLGANLAPIATPRFVNNRCHHTKNNYDLDKNLSF